MTIQNLEQTMIMKVTEAKAKVNAKFYKLFINTTTAEERELLHAKVSVLDDVTFALINEIRGNK